MLHYTNIENQLKYRHLTSQIYKLTFNVGIFQQKRKEKQ